MLQKSVKAMIIMLIAQYLFGMGVAIFGADDPAKRNQFQSVTLSGHMVIAFCLLLGSILTLVLVIKNGDTRYKKNGIGGFFSVLFAFVVGILTLVFKDTVSGIFSMLMAISFLGAFVNYGYLFFLFRKENVEVITTVKRIIH